MTETVSPSNEIERNRSALEVPTNGFELGTRHSSLGVRARGAYVAWGELTSPTTGRRISIFYPGSSLDKLSAPKVSATHPMVPYGPYEGLGGQHGFARWADYRQVLYETRASGAQRLILESVQHDGSLSLTRSFELSSDSVSIQNTVHNSAPSRNRHTSIGEHAYFNLTGGDPSGLLLDNKGLDELFGSDSMDRIANGDTLFWEIPDNRAAVWFPDGYGIDIQVLFEGETAYPPALLIWQRAGTESICVEPVAGVSRNEVNNGVVIPPQGSASLRTGITLL